MKTFLFLVVGSAIALASTAKAQEIPGEKPFNIPKLISEDQKMSINQCLVESNITYEVVATLMTRQWNYTLDDGEKKGVCCLLEAVLQSDSTESNGKGSVINPGFVKNAVAMSEKNGQVAVGEIVDKCEDYLHMDVDDLNHCHIEPRSAQFTHCFMSSINAATNGQFFESFALHATEATPSKPSTPSESSESSEPTKVSEPSSAGEPSSVIRPSSPIESSRVDEPSTHSSDAQQN